MIPLTDELVTVLGECKAARDTDYPSCPWVFQYHGERMKSIKTAWANASAKAGLVTEDGKERFLFHDLRRTAVRDLVRAGVPETVAS